jgi:hypothetical protein
MENSEYAELEITLKVLEYQRHVWLECLRENLTDPDFSSAEVYDHMIDGVIGFQAAIEHLP